MAKKIKPIEPRPIVMATIGRYQTWKKDTILVATTNLGYHWGWKETISPPVIPQPGN